MFSFQPQCAVDGPRLLATGTARAPQLQHRRRAACSAQSDAGGSPVSVISVGAICSASAAAAAVFAGSDARASPATTSSHGTIQFFSSRGPTLDGRMKPDIAAIDGVAITGAGSISERPFSARRRRRRTWPGSRRWRCRPRPASAETGAAP